MRTVWLKRAKTDLDLEIGKIAEDSPKNALIVLKKLTDLAENLYYFPYKFPKEPIYNTDNIRFAVKFSYKIVYRIDTDKIVIIRVFNSKQDPRKI